MSSGPYGELPPVIPPVREPLPQPVRMKGRWSPDIEEMIKAAVAEEVGRVMKLAEARRFVDERSEIDPGAAVVGLPDWMVGLLSQVRFAEVVRLVAEERDRAIDKHGWAQTPANPDMSMSERLVIIVEEVGEIARAMTYDEGDHDQLRAELIQTAAMCLMSIEGL